MLPETYLIVDTDNTIREAQIGQTRKTVVDAIHGFEFEAKQVFRVSGAGCQEVTEEIADEICNRMEQRREPSFLIPSLVEAVFPDRAAAIERGSWTVEQRRADAIDSRADARRERMLEEAA